MTATSPSSSRPYRVLARAYRPQRLSELIGQEAMVRTLANAFRTGRIAHAFLLTGIRGVGKTTTARIIARALNCTGPDGGGGPTPEPCGACANCVAIAEGRHIDVLEMDAATRTGIDDIREIVDSVRYAPTSARSKVYIIDEVHMLSQQAFNGLLKTLEEPPPHARFIFATTEVRRVPVTVLSRCQRFDLRRVESERLVRHLEGVAAKEGVAVEPEALALVARAAEGSVRDALSLLDQAIALGGGAGLDAAQVRDMLGLADRARVLDLLDAVMRGAAAEALDGLRELYDLGADPVTVVQDLLEATHWLTRIKLVPEAAAAFGLAEEDARRGAGMAERLSLPVLARAWQALLRGLDELKLAPVPLTAAEMLLVRLACAADLPTPAELARWLRGESEGSGAGEAHAAVPPPHRLQPGGSSVVASLRGAGGPAAAIGAGGAPEPSAQPSPPAAPRGAAAAPATADADPRSFEQAVELFRRRGEPMLHGWLYQTARPVRFEPGRIELALGAGAPKDLPSRVGAKLAEWTGRRWVVSLANAPGEPTLAERARDRRRRRLDELGGHPAVKAVLDTFPGATIVDVQPRGDAS